MPIFENSTFLLTAILIWWERKRLEQFHIGYGAIGIFIFGPFIFIIALAFYNPFGTNVNIPWGQILISTLLFIALVIQHPKLMKITTKSVLWIFISLLVGILGGALSGYILSIVRPTPSSGTITFPMFIILFIRQLTLAATLEEPLFRGFLWGYLKGLGWKDVWICFFQAGLFLIAHSYYITINLVLFINVFIFSFIMGFVAWKSRSIAKSMIVHGLNNSVADIVAHFSF